MISQLEAEDKQNMNNNTCRLKLVQITRECQGHKWRGMKFDQGKFPGGGASESDLEG